MREVNFIEDKGRFGITFMSDDKAEANTVMNAIQRFISKNSNINNLDVNSIREKIYMENIDSLLDSIEKIKKRRDLSELTYYELEYIALMEKEIVVMKEKLSMDKYTETAQPILNKMLETFTMEDLEKLKETTLLDEKYIEEEIQKRLDNKSYSQDYSRNPLDGPSKGVYLNLYTNDRLIELYNNDKLSQGHKNYIKDLLNERGVTDLSMPNTKKKNNTKNQEKSNTIIENIREHELNKKIETIKNGRDMAQLSDEELEEISLLESELASIYKYSETAKHILQGRKFNRSRELENKITQGRRLSELTLEELKELEKVTMLDNYKEDIQKEINKRENKSFEETLEEDNGIISFGEDEDDSNYRVDDENEEDPFSSGVDEDNINRWDLDEYGDKVDSEGNKLLFDD